jgi:PAS domain S-box-containing protein
MASRARELELVADPIGSILVIQRNPHARRKFCRSLRTAGYKIVELDAFAAADLGGHSPDLVIQDIGFPGTDCHEVAVTLRGYFGKTVPILAVSGFLCAVDEERAIESGFSHVLTKPLDPDHLVELVGSFLMPRLDGATQYSARDGQRLQSTLRATQLAVLAGVAEAIAETAPLHEMLSNVLEACLDMAGISQGALYLVEDGVLRLEHESGFTSSEVESLHARLGCGPFLTSIATGQTTVLVPSANVPPAITTLLTRNAGASSLLLVPVQTYGLMVLGTRSADISGDDAICFAQVLGAQMALAIGLARSFTNLATSEQRYRNLTENASDAIAIVSESGTIVEVNRRLSTMSGQSAESLVGQRFRDMMFRRDAAAAAGYDATIANGGGRMAPARIRKPDGMVVLVEFSLTPVVVGAEPLILAIGRDVTDRVHAQTQLIASERMASVGLIAAGLAHELNNPLATVIANLDLALDQQSDPMLRDARSAAERVRLIVRDLKTFSRIDDRRCSIDVQSLLESTLRLVAAELRARIVTTYGIGVPPIVANESRLAQMFVNLIDNAARAVSTRDDAGEIHIMTSIDERGDAVIQIHDNGIGIAPDALEQLFTPLFTTKSSGLGLLICRRIVTELDGALVITSAVGRGTIVKVTLPSASVVARKIEVGLPRDQPRRARVLVIDDDEMIRTAISRALSSAHDLTSFDNATAALEAIAAGTRYDIILCDLMMPGMTGMEFYERLRVLVPEQIERLVFLTGGTFTLHAQQFLDSVPNVCLEKPYSNQQLRSLVAERVQL